MGRVEMTVPSPRSSMWYKDNWLFEIVGSPFTARPQTLHWVRD
ncbi:hypothetical protein ACVMIX_006429 [Rhizobium leguminosarum]